MHADVFLLTDRLRTPADATPEDAKTAGAAFIKVNGKGLEVTEAAMEGYSDILSRTVKRMPLDEFRVRRSIARGMFTVASALSTVLIRVRVNGILRTDELGDHVLFALEEARQAATGPGGPTNARAQEAFTMLDGAAQDMIDKQKQGKTDALKQEAQTQLQVGDMAAAYAAAAAKVKVLENLVAQLQQTILLNSPTPAVGPTPVHHKAHPAPAPTPTTPGGSVPPGLGSRTIPRG